MLQQLKFAFKSLNKNRLQSILNICGLSLGLSMSIAIAVTIVSLVSMDKFHENQDSLFKVCYTEDIKNGRYSDATSALLGPTVKDEIPEIEDYCRYFWANELLLGSPENYVNENGFYADKTIFKMLSFPLIKGDYNNLFNDYNNIAISEKLSKKLFGERESIGEHINLYTYNEDRPMRFTVTGVFKDVTDLSSLKFEYIIPFEYHLSKNQGKQSWGHIGTRTFIQIKQNTNIQELKKKITSVINAKRGDARPNTFRLAPIAKSSGTIYSFDGKPFIGFYALLSFGMIGLAILIISVINFINLSIASSINRTREICVKKVNGADKKAIVVQFFSETSVLVLLSAFIGVIIHKQILDLFEIETHPNLLFMKRHLFFVLPCILCFTVILAAWYPSLHLTKFNPARMLKGAVIEKKGIPTFRASLVIFQFVAAIVLITSSLILSKQVDHLYTTSLNVDRDNLIYFKKNAQLNIHWKSFREELLKRPGIESVTFVDQSPTQVTSSTTSVEWEGKEPNQGNWYSYVLGAPDFAKTFKLNLLKGRDFSLEKTNEGDKIIINETACKEMGMEDPIGKTIRFWGEDVEIVGMVENFSHQFLTSEKEPIYILYRPNSAYLTMVRLQNGAEQAGISSMEKVFKRFSPDFILDYTYLDYSFNQMHQTLKSLQKVISLSGYFAIFVACLGLFGLVVHSSERKVKELGIRKINGAKITDIIHVLSKQSVKWLAIATLIGFPLSYFLMSKVLQLFPIRVDLEISPFIYSLFGISILTFLIISIQIWRVARRNPVEALRYE